ncbi:MAG: signal recognition particle-docking protein FtsY [Pseudomonadota bacterium]|nr:signal recognition particle-docking protein FtsY [Pseudomonadota bacterium]
MWGGLIDFVLQQERAIELAAAFLLGTGSWGIVSTTIRAAYRWRSRRRRTPPPEVETAPPSHEAPAGGVELAPAHPAPIAPEVPTEDEALEPDLSAPVQDEAFEPESTARDSAPAVPPPAGQKRGWWTRLRDGLSRSSGSIGEGLAAILTKRKLDASMLDDLEDVLIRADLGGATAARIAKAIGYGRHDKDIGVEEAKAVLAAEIERALTPYAQPLEIDTGKKPFVILVVGVNGSGKTTTIGKLAARFSSNGNSVLLAAGDTFRAAAIEQLRIWGERVGCPVIAHEQGGDASALAYDAIKAARERGTGVMLMDTAGRLQNRAELMAELKKIIRVMKKVDPGAPHAVLLVLDATVGQNAINQVEIFGRIAGVTGLVMTKLDGTARGGILVAIAEKFQLPVHFIGVGEGVNDLEAFEARDFARAIAGLED